MASQLRVNAHRKRLGRIATEMLEVDDNGDGSYTLLHSPVYVQNLAAGDVFTLDEEGWAEVRTRGGNVCVQVFHRLDFAPMEQMRARVAALGGHGFELNRETAVFTIPVHVGFSRIEAPFTRIERLYGDRMTWRFGNVYDEDGETPLDWWVQLGREGPGDDGAPEAGEPG